MIAKLYREERCFVQDTQLADWTVEYGSGGPQRVSGPCPACGHTTEKEIELEFAASARGTTEAQPDPREWITRIVQCACGEPHQDEAIPPKQFTSCGRWWLASMRRTKSDTEPNIREAYDKTLLKAAQAVEPAVTAEETIVRSSAGKWTGALPALFGLFSLAGLVFGKDALDDVSGWGRAIAAVAAFLALVAAVASTYLVYRAAYGWPILTDIGDDEKLRAWYAKRRDHLPKSARQLRQGVKLAIGAMALLAVAVAVIWLSPAKTAQPLVLVSRLDQSEVCGILLDTEASALGQLRIKKPSGAVVPVPLVEVSTITAAETCP